MYAILRMQYAYYSYENLFQKILINTYKNSIDSVCIFRNRASPLYYTRIEKSAEDDKTLRKSKPC